MADIKEPTHAERARTVVEHGTLGCLATLALDPAGFPFGSLVAYALDEPGHPLLLVSDLAEHTHNFRADPRASLLVSEEGLAQARVTLLGRIQAADDARERYLARHPKAQQYVDFKDFHFYRLKVETVRYVGGFGRMSWVGLADYQAAAPDPLFPHRSGILEHMNEDHQEAMLLIARHQAQLEGTQARMVEVDRYGYELTIDGKPVRLPFSRPIERTDQVRKELVAHTQAAREALQP